MLNFQKFLLIEKKDHIIKKIPSLTKDQKKELIKLFVDKPHLERKIDWNKWKNLTYQDFEDVINSESKREKKKKVKKSGIRGLKKNKDYIELKLSNKKYEAYIPLSWEASKLIASKYVGNCEGKWCTAYQKDSSYWSSYVHKHAIILVYLIHPEYSEKYAVAIHKNNHTYEIFDEEDNPVSDIPDFDVKSLFSGSLKKLYDEARHIILLENSFLKDARYSKDAVFSVVGTDYVVWEKGTWYDGIWKGGEWNSGTFEKGRFLDGLWRDGVFKGTQFQGSWMNGTFEGEFFDGKKTFWSNGIFKSGVFAANTWYDGIWEDGEWYSGKWVQGYDKDGKLHKFPPSIWSDEDVVKTYQKRFNFIHLPLERVADLFKDTLARLNVYMDHNQITSISSNKPKLEVGFGTDNKQFVIQESNININKFLDFGKMSVRFQDCVVTNLKYDYRKQPSTMIFFDSDIYGGEFVLYEGVPFVDCIITGIAVIDVENLKSYYRSAFSDANIIVKGGSIVSRKGLKQGYQFTDDDRITFGDVKDAQLKGIKVVPSNAENCYIYRCMVSGYSNRYKNCEFVECVFDENIQSDIEPLVKNNDIKGTVI